MSHLILKVVVFLALFIPSVASAKSVTVSGYVKKLDLHTHNWQNYNVNDTGFASIYLDELPIACGTGLKRVVIHSTHPLFPTVISTLLAAKIANKKVHITYLDSCQTRSGAWDFGYISFQ